MAAVLGKDVLYLIMGFLGVDDLHTVSNLYIPSRDTAAVRDLCFQLRDAAAPHQRRRLRRLFVKAFEWVAANPGRTFIAGSASLYLHLQASQDHAPGWIPNDIDVFVLPDNSRDYNDIVDAVNKPPDDESMQLTFNGSFMNKARGVVSTLAYPFGKIQVIYIGGYSFRADDAQFTSQVRGFIDTFDHSAVMIATVDGSSFIHGPRFEVRTPVMYRPIKGTENLGSSELSELNDRFWGRYNKYARRGLAPVCVKCADICGWLNIYNPRDGYTTTFVRPYLKGLE
jgi:hypothetical protein